MARRGGDLDGPTSRKQEQRLEVGEHISIGGVPLLAERELRLVGHILREGVLLEEQVRGVLDRGLCPSGRWCGSQAMTAHDFADLFDIRRAIAS